MTALCPMSSLCLMQMIVFLSKLRCSSLTSQLPHLIVFLLVYQARRNFHSSEFLLSFPQPRYPDIQLPLDGPRQKEKLSGRQVKLKLKERQEKFAPH